MNVSKLKKAIELSRMTKKEIAEKCGFSRTTLDGALQGEDVKISTVEKLSRVLGVPVGEFFNDDEHISEVSETKRHPQQRGDNAMIVLYKKFRAFMRWANGLDKDYLIEPLTHNNPFDRFPLKSERYGTPFYLTVEERDRLAKAELPPRLARQRDIFIFHSFIGCRVSDLWAMTKKNVVDGNFIEYIPRKTADGRPVTVRVPLTKSAKEILERYKDCPGDKLLPFVAQQQYNLDIKDMLEKVGITRMVTILDPLTRQEVKKPINEVASSHMARRTFIGNLYKQVKDPNLVGKLSGHVEGSKAFARYRDIDEDMAKELVSLLE